MSSSPSPETIDAAPEGREGSAPDAAPTPPSPPSPPPPPPGGEEALRTQERDIFACLNAFGAALLDVFQADTTAEAHLPLQIYVTLTEGPLKNVADARRWPVVREYVNGFKRFWREYGPVLKHASPADPSWASEIPEDATILYKGRFAIHLGQLLRNPLCTDATRRTIREHLAMLGALVDEDEEELARFRAVAPAPAPAAAPGSSQGSTDAASFIGELVQELGLEEGGADLTPEEGLNRMISGGGMQRIMGKMTQRLESGELDIGQLLQGLMGGLSGVLQGGGGAGGESRAPPQGTEGGGGAPGGLTDGLGGMLSTLGTVVEKTGGVQGWNGLVGTRGAPSVDDLDASLDATMERWRERGSDAPVPGRRGGKKKKKRRGGGGGRK